MKIQVNGIELYYETVGQGQPLLMIHGNGEDHTIFTEACELLKEKYCCYLIDSRGHGKSSYVDAFHYQDMADDIEAFLEALNLENAVYYGFSDGGIIGLLLAMHCSRVSKMIISGANITTRGVKKKIRALFKVINVLKKDPKIELMMKEPSIHPSELKKITIPVLVLAGEKDLVLETETRTIAKALPNGELKILKGEGHGSYIVHKTKIAELILEWLG